MNELKKYAEMKASKQKEMTDLVDKVKQEERAFTPEEDELFTQLEKEIQSITDTVAKINKSRQLTEEKDGEDAGNNDDKEEKEDMKDEEKRSLEEIEQRDIEAFAKYIREDIMEERADSGMTVGSNGVIVPTSIANKIITNAVDMSPILSKATKYNTKGTLEIPVYGKTTEGADITVGYAEDFKELEAKAGNFTSVSLKDYLVASLTLIGKSLINNSDIDVVSKVIEIMSEYFQIFLEGEAIHGTADKIDGLSKNTNKVEEVAITYEALVKTKNAVKQAFRKNGIWVMNQNTQTLLETMKDGNDRPLFNADPTGVFDGKVLGYPVYVSDNMPDAVAGNEPILFGDFSGLAFKSAKNLEIEILREKYATQHAVGIVGFTEVDMKIEHVQKIASLVLASE